MGNNTDVRKVSCPDFFFFVFVPIALQCSNVDCYEENPC